MSSTALPAPRTAASTTAAGSPAMITTERLWAASMDQSSRRTASTRIAATMASTRRASVPSEKLGTHSTTGSLMRASDSVYEHVLAFPWELNGLRKDSLLLKGAALAVP